MLIKVTNKCSMGCSHCMEDSTLKGEHMTWETFQAALDFAKRIEGPVWAMGVPPLILLSGGECTEHPEIERYVAEVIYRRYIPVLVTNGMWLGDAKLCEALLNPGWKTLFIQVTNDPRYYPSKPPRVDDPRITYVDSLTVLLPLGRLARKRGEPELPIRKAPSSFNLRSMARHFGDFARAVQQMRLRAMMNLGGHCSPSISDNGDVMAGETRNCFKLGTVWSSNLELSRAICDMKCNRCGLVDVLTPIQKQAIGEL